MYAPVCDESYNHHDVLMKSVGVILDDPLTELSLDACFKEDLMPQVRRLRKAISDYDNFKGRILEVAKAIDSILNICLSFMSKHSAIFDYLEPKLRKISKQYSTSNLMISIDETFEDVIGWNPNLLENTPKGKLKERTNKSRVLAKEKEKTSQAQIQNELYRQKVEKEYFPEVYE